MYLQYKHTTTIISINITLHIPIIITTLTRPKSTSYIHTSIHIYIQAYIGTIQWIYILHAYDTVSLLVFE